MAKLGMTLRALRDLLGGGEIRGDEEFYCSSVASLEKAGPDCLSFVKGERHIESARRSRAGALLTASPIQGFAGHQVIIEQPQEAFGVVLGRIAASRQPPSGVDSLAVVDRGASIGAEVAIGPGAVVGKGATVGDRARLGPNVYIGENSSLGDDSVLYPNVVVLAGIRIGKRVVIRSGTVIGAEGYGYIQRDGRSVPVPQVGTVEIGDDVEIGALTTIDRATVDATVIGARTKIGDMVHVGHNCVVGEDVLLLPTCMVSGSVKIGDKAILAGHAGTSDNLEIGAGAVLAGASVAFKDVAPGQTVWGVPAREKGLEMRIQAALKYLPQMLRDWRAAKSRD
jgi:UDP-3-O-[3-hydroxymyristoyl] glucosamine N-acyltransferase